MYLEFGNDFKSFALRTSCHVGALNLGRKVTGSSFYSISEEVEECHEISPSRGPGHFGFFGSSLGPCSILRSREEERD